MREKRFDLYLKTSSIKDDFPELKQRKKSILRFLFYDKTIHYIFFNVLVATFKAKFMLFYFQ